MASSQGSVSLHPYGTRTQMMTLPPVPAPSASNRWTGLYLVSNPLPEHVSFIQFDITSHDQGWCTNPQGGVWSWFEVSVLGSWMEDANPDLQNLPDKMSLKSCPDDFGKAFHEQGLYFKDIPGEGQVFRHETSSEKCFDCQERNSMGLATPHRHMDSEWQQRHW